MCYSSQMCRWFHAKEDKTDSCDCSQSEQRESAAYGDQFVQSLWTGRTLWRRAYDGEDQMHRRAFNWKAEQPRIQLCR